jgi:uncharacterized transporter YbjL
MSPVYIPPPKITNAGMVDVSSAQCAIMEIVTTNDNVLGERMIASEYGTVILPMFEKGYQLIRGGKYVPQKTDDLVQVRSKNSDGLTLRPSSKGFITSRGR